MSPLPIVAPPSAGLMDVGAWLKGTPAAYAGRFHERIVPAIWGEFTRLGLDPVIGEFILDDDAHPAWAAAGGGGGGDRKDET